MIPNDGIYRVLSECRAAKLHECDNIRAALRRDLHSLQQYPNDINCLVRACTPCKTRARTLTQCTQRPHKLTCTHPGLSHTHIRIHTHSSNTQIYPCALTRTPDDGCVRSGSEQVAFAVVADRSALTISRKPQSVYTYARNATIYKVISILGK